MIANHCSGVEALARTAPARESRRSGGEELAEPVDPFEVDANVLPEELAALRDRAERPSREEGFELRSTGREPLVEIACRAAAVL